MHRGDKRAHWIMAAAAIVGMVGGLGISQPVAQAQAPLSVPSARFYGRVYLSDGRPPTNLTLTAAIGNSVCSGTQAVSGSQGESGTDNSGNYSIDIQANPGCTTPGSTVRFTASGGAAGGYNAKETGTLPAIPGTAVHLDLHLEHPATPTRTATAPAPPPPPTVVATTRPTTAPPPPPVTTPRATPRATVAPARTPIAQHGVVQQAPRGPVKGPVAVQAPYKPAPVAAGGGGYQAPAAAPRLPNTGTGGLLDSQTSTLTGWALMAIVLAALGMSAVGLTAYRRSR